MESGGRSPRGTNAAKSRRVSPGRSSPRGSSSPLGGSCYPRRKPSLPAGPGPFCARVGLLPAQCGRCPRPARSARPPARPRLISQTAAAAGPGGGRLGGARGPGARDGRAGDLAGERGRAPGAGGAQLRSPTAARRAAAARSAAESAAGKSPSSYSSPLGRARLPGAPGSLRALAGHASPAPLGGQWRLLLAPASLSYF